jgi:molybdopterin-synthase adenylyltransferase
MPRSAVLRAATHAELVRRLLRDDLQEDLCFAVWHPSTGAQRITAIVMSVIAPEPGDRNVHETASFESHYFQRAARATADAGGGLALLHSHPRGTGWQGMSGTDVETERRHAKRALAMTGLPLVGMTMAGDQALSARFWERVGRGEYARRPCENVRVSGDELSVTWDDALVTPPRSTAAQIRTVASWGEEVQRSWTRLRIVIVGAGTVGAIVGEALARMGATEIVLLDHDTVEELNLDRLLHGRPRDALLRRAKADVLARGLRRAATATSPRITASDRSVVEPHGLALALDADLIFSCVDRPWPRAALNYAAYAHMIPVVDVGVRVTRTPRGRMRNAIWRAHVVAPGRQCLACLGQYEPGQVQAERDGSLDDPKYIRRLPDDSPLRSRQNVFGFALGAGSLAVNQFISTVVAPGGVGNVGALLYQLKLARLDREHGSCHPHCPFAAATGRGDMVAGTFVPTGVHAAAERARAARSAPGRRLRLARRLDDAAEHGADLLDRAVRRFVPAD